jgi:DNA-binding CsgD family transcriptional regulator
VGNRAARHYADAINAHRAGVDPRPYRQAGDVLIDGLHWRWVLLLVAASAGHLAALAENPVADLRAMLCTFDRLGETAFADACRRVLRGLGVAVPRNRGDVQSVPELLRAMGVTARENDVLRLVAQRRSNADIASELYLSPRTVEAHISHLLTKTGTADRIQLGRLING